MTTEKKDLKYYMGLPYTIVLRRDEDGDFVAKIQELVGCVSHGPEEAVALRRLEDVKAVWIQDCIESSEVVPEPRDDEDKLPSGKWLQRVPRSLHKKITYMAKQKEVSLNRMFTSILAEAVSTRGRFHHASAQTSGQVLDSAAWQHPDSERELHGVTASTPPRSGVPVQREMEKERSPLASIPPLRGGDFQGIRVYR
ncbi:MAG: type II toxin-antitoxin system HicB family antitoxin, partial [Acidobacteriota bacterium]|nr:type II toxin-antitoxin system HicB family antitoxin [Acidobacteriota bacterium]